MRLPSFLYLWYPFASLNLINAVVEGLDLYDTWTAHNSYWFLSPFQILGFSCIPETKWRSFPFPPLIPGVRQCDFIPNYLLDKCQNLDWIVVLWLWPIMVFVFYKLFPQRSYCHSVTSVRMTHVSIYLSSQLSSEHQISVPAILFAFPLLSWSCH